MHDDNEYKIEAKSDNVSDVGTFESVTTTDIDYLPPKEIPDQDLYHSHSWWTTYVFSQDAKYIGIQYAFTAIGTGLLGLILSWLMRMQIAFPGLGLLEPAAYYQFVTMHGMIMVVYLLTALFLGGFGNLLIPLMCGSRDMAFPYVNMLSYWMFLIAVIVLLASFFVPGGPTGAGWTLYPPQAITAGTAGSNAGITLMLISLVLFVAGFTMGGLNYIVTTLQYRTQGMTLMRLPLTVWGIFTATVLAMFAFPALLVGCIMMTLDNVLGTSFFMPTIISMGEKLGTEGGSPILFQHLFWFFGHPEVYILIIPAFGIISIIISSSYQKIIFGNQSMIFAMSCISLLGSLVWGHHMYTVGLESDTRAYFTGVTILISLPTGTKIFNWLSTYLGNPPLLHLKTTSGFFGLLFLLMFTIGGSTGIILGNAAVDLGLHDTYYVVAHFHFVLSLGAVIAIFSGIIFIGEKILGSKILLPSSSSSLSLYHLVSTFIGILLTFSPMHFLGFNVMPRRIPDFPDYFNSWNYLSSIGSGITLICWLYIEFMETGFLSRRTIPSYPLKRSTYNRLSGSPIES